MECNNKGQNAANKTTIDVELCKNNNSKPSTSSPSSFRQIQLKRLDHYTLITNNAKLTSTNHTNILKYKLDKIQPINSGTVSGEGEIDMLNYVMKPPLSNEGSDDRELVMVVTEGLNDDTVFRKYMKKFGEGIHHFGKLLLCAYTWILQESFSTSALMSYMHIYNSYL